MQRRTEPDEEVRLLVSGIPPCMGNIWRSDRALARAKRQFPTSHADAQRSRDDFEALLLTKVDVLGNSSAGRSEVVAPQRSIVCLPGRFEDAEPVPREPELVPYERAGRAGCPAVRCTS